MKFSHALTIAILTVMILSCSDADTKIIRDEQGNILEEYQVDNKTGVKNGLYKRYDEDGILIERSDYRMDTLHGIREIYFPDGDVNIRESYEKGIFVGEYLEYHPEGTIAAKGEYVNGMMEGEWLYYYPSGQLRERVTFSNNAENGPFEEYYENGNFKARGKYKGGDFEHGLLELFDSTGTLNRKMECDMGICRTIWSVDEVE